MSTHKQTKCQHVKITKHVEAKTEMDLHDSVERGALVVQRLSFFANSFLTSAQSAEIFNSLGDNVSVEAHNDAANWLAISLDVKEYFVRDGGTSSCKRHQRGENQRQKFHGDGVGFFMCWQQQGVEIDNLTKGENLL